MLLNAAVFNTKHGKVSIKGKVGQSREWCRVLPYTCVVAFEKGAFESPSIKVANLYIYIYT